EFYEVYDHYTAAIVAIPGNHDGEEPPSPANTLRGFKAHFCNPAAASGPPASDRDPLRLPNPYWVLNTPVATVIGGYTNVDHIGTLDDPSKPGPGPQEKWLRAQLQRADPKKALILALHHQVYSLDK